MVNASRILVWAFLMAIVVPGSRLAAQESLYINPGIKLGYTLGDDDIVEGIEISIVRWPNKATMSGVCVSFERKGALNIFHVAFEAGGVIGLSVGPSIVGSGRSGRLGFAATVWSGLGVMPYFRYTSVPGRPDFSEMGSFFKLPIRIDGPKILGIGF